MRNSYLTVAIAASCLLGSAGATWRVFPGRGPVAGLEPVGPITAAAVPRLCRWRLRLRRLRL